MNAGWSLIDTGGRMEVVTKTIAINGQVSIAIRNANILTRES